MPNEDLFAGLEVNGKIIEGDPVKTITPKMDVVDNSDLFEGLQIGENVIEQITPETGKRGMLDIVTGSERIAARPELGTLPEFGATKEGDVPRIALGMLSTFDPKAQQDIIKQAIPEANFETFEDGSTIIEVPTSEGGTRRSVLNRPGFSPQDLMTSTAQVLSFIPAAKLANIGKTILQKVGIGALGAGATEQALQETGVALGREERDPASTAIAAATGGIAEAVVPAIQAVRGSRQAAQFGAARDELSQVAESVATAQEASKKTGIPLFQAQQTAVPAMLEKQSFVAQLPAGTRAAMRGLKAQNKAAGDAVESFINDIAPPESVITGAEKVRTAAQNALEKARAIRAEKTSPLYNKAFAENVDVDISPVTDLIKSELSDLPDSGEIARTLKKTAGLLKGKPKIINGEEIVSPPSLRQIHNAKLEIDQMLNKFGENSLGNTTKAKLTEVKDLLLNQIDDASDSYRLARETFAAESPPVTKIRDSIIGKIANLNDDQLKQVSSKIFDPAQTNPKVLLSAKKAISDVDPDAWKQIVRVELEKRLGSVKPQTETGTIDNIPGQLFRALFPNDKSTKVLMNALDQNGKENLKFLKTALERARLGRPGGSQTAGREEIKRELRSGVTLAIRDLITNPIKSVTGLGADTAFDRNASTLSKALFDPTWKGEMRRIRQLNPNSPAAARAMTQLFRDVEKSTQDSQKEQPEQ